MAKLNIETAATIRKLDRLYLEKRFYRFVKPSDGCWQWRGEIISTGYGRLFVEGRHVLAHRLAYLLFHGDISDDLKIDHICRNRACVNPQHMELVSERENIHRGIGPTAENHKKQTCPRGHPYDGFNSTSGSRYCKRCKAMASRQERLARGAKPRPGRQVWK